MAKVVRKSDRGARKRAEKEERIIKAATELIFAKGFEATKMDEIAQRADVSKGSLYLHFKTKDEIYLLIRSESAPYHAGHVRGGGRRGDQRT